MDKKGLSLIIATLFLISLGLILGGIFLVWATNFISNLSPPVDCNGISFNAEIIEEQNGEFYLDIVNMGNVQIGGATIKSAADGQVNVEEKIEFMLNPGKTESIKLNSINSDDKGKKLLVVPIIPVESYNKTFFKSCNDDFGSEVEF
ncbi:hypothetical protein HYV50_01585 [Candidatus Pacearchaeota archaeon]|nr:hypothetical protein [Candidatus Pacearchaeota archaeon]